MEKKDVILRNSRAEQYLCAAKKNFIEGNGILSESHSKTVICHFLIYRDGVENVV